MRLSALALLLSLIFLAGCFGPATPAPPQYVPPGVYNASSNPHVPAAGNAPNPASQPPASTQTPVVPVNTPNSVNPPAVVTPPVVIPTPEANHSTPANSSVSLPVPSTPSVLCAGSGSSDALECIIVASIAQKKVSVCLQLSSQEDRYKCFTRWCYSASRDYHQCEGLNKTDDRLGCLIKCNPNFNT